MSESVTAIAEALDAWQLSQPLSIEPLEGGINAHTWLVYCAAELFVAVLSLSNVWFFRATRGKTTHKKIGTYHAAAG